METMFNLKTKVADALKSNKLVAQNTFGNDFFVMIKIKVEGEPTMNAFRKFKDFLEREKLRYISSFSAKMGIMNISVYSY
ncbi:hypothetical protein [Emticicia sp. 17c]|uniref:hypothetical protein n=1 Tax=Emticicia sp. 17c TaxID=3127704 RepID=UPI00301CE20E